MKRSKLVVLALCCALVSGCATVAQNGVSDKEGAGAPGTMDLYREGMKAYQEGDMETAETKLSAVLEKVPQDAQVWFRLGNVFARTDRPRLAVRAYQDALMRDPRLAKAWHNMGVVHLRQAANDFISLANAVPPEDPLHERGRKMSNTILALLNELPEGKQVNIELDLKEPDETDDEENDR